MKRIRITIEGPLEALETSIKTVVDGTSKEVLVAVLNSIYGKRNMKIVDAEIKEV